MLLPIRMAKPGVLPSPFLFTQPDPHNLLLLIILICPLLSQLSLAPKKLSPCPRLANLFLFRSPSDHGLIAATPLDGPRHLNKSGVWGPSIPGPSELWRLNTFP